MTEEKLDTRLQKRPKRRVIGLVLAALALLVAVIWLARQPIAEGIAGSICAQQNLKCKLKVSRLDCGGLTFSDLEVKNPKAPNPALTATRLAIDLNWASLFSPRATSVAGDDLVLRLDLSGTRPLLGDLDEAVKNFTKGGGEPGPMPRLD